MRTFDEFMQEQALDEGLFDKLGNIARAPLDLWKHGLAKGGAEFGQSEEETKAQAEIANAPKFFNRQVFQMKTYEQAKQLATKLAGGNKELAIKLIRTTRPPKVWEYIRSLKKAAGIPTNIPGLF